MGRTSGSIDFSLDKEMKDSQLKLSLMEPVVWHQKKITHIEMLPPLGSGK